MPGRRRYCAGGNLRQLLSDPAKRTACLWRAGGRRIALDAARGLNFLHSCRIVHRSESRCCAAGIMQKLSATVSEDETVRTICLGWLTCKLSLAAGGLAEDYMLLCHYLCDLLYLPMQGHKEQQHPAGRLGACQGGGRWPGVPAAHRGPGRARRRHLRECLIRAGSRS